MNKSIKDILENNQLKLTKSRIAVLEVLMGSKKPMDIDTIYTLLPKKMNKTTLYRILNTYSEMGIVYRTDFRDGKAYFEFQENHHHHIVCTQCGIKEDIQHCNLDKDVSNLKSNSRKFKTVTSHSLEFFGLCKECV